MKKVLYLGLAHPYHHLEGEIIYYPIIKIVPRSFDNLMIQNAYKDFHHYTHLVITSKTTIPLIFDFAASYGIDLSDIKEKQVIAVGRATAAAAARYGMRSVMPISDETSEGIVATLEVQDLSNAYLFWPHSALSRQVLPDFFKSKKIKYCECIFYETLPNWEQPPPNFELDSIDEIVFTSPSTVDAFVEIMGPIPWNKQITPIGPITDNHLQNLIESSHKKEDA